MRRPGVHGDHVGDVDGQQFVRKVACWFRTEEVDGLNQRVGADHIAGRQSRRIIFEIQRMIGVCQTLQIMDEIKLGHGLFRFSSVLVQLFGAQRFGDGHKGTVHHRWLFT